MKIIALMENTSLPGLHAEHGLSLYIETCGLRILFDAGQTEYFADNAEKLGVDLSKVDLAILSHGHYDHGGGMLRFLEINDHAPLYMNRHAFEPHFSGKEKFIGLNSKLHESGRIVYTDDEFKLAPNLRLCTCNGLIPSFEPPEHGLYMMENGALTLEDFRHEQYLVVSEDNRRIVFSGCSHKGILNILDWLRPDILIGGFHFKKLDPNGSGREALTSAAHEMAKFDTLLYTCHCTGHDQYEFIKPLLGDQLHYLSGGETLIL